MAGCTSGRRSAKRSPHTPCSALRSRARIEIPIAADRVDLAVVRDHPERMREVPRGERVRRVTLVENRERAGEERRLEIGEKFPDPGAA